MADAAGNDPATSSRPSDTVVGLSWIASTASVTVPDPYFCTYIPAGIAVFSHKSPAPPTLRSAY